MEDIEKFVEGKRRSKITHVTTGEVECAFSLPRGVVVRDFVRVGKVRIRQVRRLFLVDVNDVKKIVEEVRNQYCSRR